MDAKVEELLKAMRHVTASDDAVVIVVRGHILIEHLLDSVLEEYLRGGLRPFAKPPFRAKVQLAYSVGLLNDEEREVFIEFNRIRNRVAHRLDGVPTCADEDKVRRVLSRLAPGLDKAKGHETYQLLVTILFALIMARGENVHGKTAPLMAKSPGDEYTQELSLKLWVPLFAGLDHEKSDPKTWAAAIVVAVLSNLHKLSPEEVASTLESKAVPKDSGELEQPPSIEH